MVLYKDREFGAKANAKLVIQPNDNATLAIVQVTQAIVDCGKFNPTLDR